MGKWRPRRRKGRLLVCLRGSWFVVISAKLVDLGKKKKEKTRYWTHFG